jgi:hypothetical protein
MIQSKQVRIDNNEYTITQFAGTKSLRVQIKLVKLIGPTLGAFLGSDNLNLSNLDDLMGSDISSESISKAVGVFVGELDADMTTGLIMELLSETRVNNKEMSEALFTDTFVGNFSELYRVLAEIIKFNYSSVFKRGASGNLTAS